MDKVLESRVASLEQRMDAVEQVLQDVPRIRPTDDVDKMVDALVADAIEGAYRAGKEK